MFATEPEWSYPFKKKQKKPPLLLYVIMGGLIVFLLSDLMLQTAVLALRVFPDDHDVNVLMTSLDTRE